MKTYPMDVYSIPDEFLRDTDVTYQECEKYISQINRIIFRCDSLVIGNARSFLIPALYGIWERFFRVAIIAYVNSIEKIELNPTDLPHRLGITLVSRRLRKLHKITKSDYKIEYTTNEDLKKYKSQLWEELAFLNEKARFHNPEDWVNTNSNVNFTIVKENMLQMGVDFGGLLEHFKTTINLETELNRFVDMRNDIAHGAHLHHINSDELLFYETLILNLMNALSLELYNKLKLVVDCYVNPTATADSIAPRTLPTEG